MEDRFGLVPEHACNTPESAEMGRGPMGVSLGAEKLGNVDVDVERPHL